MPFTLHVDVDGPDPLGVVSGDLCTTGQRSADASEPDGWRHFVGRVTADDGGAGERRIVVDDFSVAWPAGGSVDGLRLALRRSGSRTPRAEVVFVDRASGRELGPFTATRTSSYFRRVEIDIDREHSAPPIEPYDTHLHPDRPTRLARTRVTVRNVYAAAGIRIDTSSETAEIVDVAEAGADSRWSTLELNDSMQLHWDAFANRPQWKAWLFLAGRSDRERMGGLMFDADIDEPGGVDRQGVAVFTRCAYFHTRDGANSQMNPPAGPAARRELFFNTVHELGHVFNLAHPQERRFGQAWASPPWMRSRNSRRAITWMNYPSSAMPGYGANATWFYRRFGFSFDRHELLYLRHAPERAVEMGGDAWSVNHSRAAGRSIDRRLELRLTAQKQRYEFGEPVLVELRLRNVSEDLVPMHTNLDPRDGLVEVSVVGPAGTRRPHLPVDQTRVALDERVLLPNDPPVYALVNLTVGVFGCAFKAPGRYRVDACYRNLDGSASTASLRLEVLRPPDERTDHTVRELFNARVGRVLYVGGTRAQDEVNDKIDWVRQRLGRAHPVSLHLTAIRFAPLATAAKIVEPARPAVRTLQARPDDAVANLAPEILDHPEAIADTLGHIGYRTTVNTLSLAAVEAGQPALAHRAQQQMLGLFGARGVPRPILADIEQGSQWRSTEMAATTGEQVEVQR